MRLIPSLPDNQLADFVRPDKYRDWAERYRVQMQFEGFRRAIISTLYRFMPDDHLANYRRVQQHGIPVLLIWGEEDRTLDIAGADVVRDVARGEADEGVAETAAGQQRQEREEERAHHSPPAATPPQMSPAAAR